MKTNRWCCLVLFWALTVVESSAANANNAVTLLDPQEWKALAAQIPTERRPARFEATAADGLLFALEGELAQPKSMRWERTWNGGGIPPDGFFLLEYQARWLWRKRPATDVIALASRQADGKPATTSLVQVPDLVDDGTWHRLVIRRTWPTVADKLRVMLDSVDSRTWLRIRRMEFVRSVDEFGAALETDKSAVEPTEFSPVGLQQLFNDRFDRLAGRRLARPGDPLLRDGGVWFDRTDIVVGGIPFRVVAAPNTDNLVAPPPEPEQNKETIEQFGVKGLRGALAPISRDSRVTVAVNKPATEIFLLLAAELPSRTRNYFVVEGPTALDNAEQFAVELDYADGTRDFAFPFSLTNSDHVIRRTLSVYAVPANGAQLAQVVLHNRTRGAQVSLAALTVQSGTRRLPALAEEPRRIAAKPAPLDKTVRPYARREGNVLRLGNAHFDLALDADRALAPVSFKHRRAASAETGIATGALLEAKFGGRAVPPENCKLRSIREVPGGFAISYSLTGSNAVLCCTATVTVDASDEAAFQLALTNPGEPLTTVELRFPVMRGLRLGNVADLQCFFPQYRNALGPDRAAYYSCAGASFPMQFFDVFNPRLGCGVWLRTQDRDNGERRFFLAKRDDGVEFCVEYPTQATRLAPGGTVVLPRTTLGFHAGDWHEAACRYRDWLASWYRPVKSQDKPWLRGSWVLLAEIADGVDEPFYKLPAWYDAATKTYRFRAIADEWRRRTGYAPDILHMWAWTYTPGNIQRWGEYAGADYDAVGGLPAFQKAIADVQKNPGIPVSLYINATLCGRDTEPGKRLGENAALTPPNGKPSIPYPNTFRMCHAYEPWIEHMEATYQRLLRETGARILYVDELPTRQDVISKSGRSCFSAAHGHPTPSAVNATDIAFMRRLRETVPASVPLYGEYPAFDAIAQYFDACIHYYFIPRANELFCRVFDAEHGNGGGRVALNLYRFMFPKLLHLDLPLGTHFTSWHELKFTFFNGEAIYASIWNLDESRGREFMAHACDLKKRFNDCFTTDAPEMLVTTEYAEVYANLFPGNRRTLWTLYNARPATVRGPILAIPHKPGAVYRDEWNARELKPRIESGVALLSLEMEPQSIGCVTQTW